MATGTGVVDFGVWGISAQVDVADASITNFFEAWIGGNSNAENTFDNHRVESLHITSGAIDSANHKVAVYVDCFKGVAHGKYTFSWAST